jgi:hypothetical protein
VLKLTAHGAFARTPDGAVAWARRCWMTAWLAVCIAALAIIAAGSASAGGNDGPIREGGNGVKHFYSFDGYMQSTTNCEYYGDNPNVRPGRAHTGTIIGNMWLENGTLYNDALAKGVLNRDGSFHLDYPKERPSSLRRIDGRIGRPDPDGIRAPVTGTWTAPYPNGTSECLTKYVITKGYVNLDGGFGVPLTYAKPSQGSDAPLAPIAAGVVGAGLLGGLLLWRKPWKPRCRCVSTAKIAGERELLMGDPGASWTLEPSGGGVGALDTWLVGTVPDSDQRPPKKIRSLYAVKPSEKCTGGGSVAHWSGQWTIAETAADHVTLAVAVTAGTKCANGTTATINCNDRLTIALRAHCGPDITDQYIAALNRVIHRVRTRNQRLKALGIDIDDIGIGTAIDTTLSALGSKVGLVDWDEAEYGPLHLGEFLVANGPWINFRPYSQAYKRKGGQPPYWAPGDCPSCLKCGATITFLGMCIDNYVTDAFMYGVACGVLGVKKQVMVSGGLFAKYLGDHLNAETYTGAIPAWAIGHEMGQRAYEDPNYRVGAVDPWLIRLVKFAPSRPDCRRCSKKVVINGVDWASLDWSTKSLLKGHGEKVQYPSPPPSTTTPFPTKRKLIKLPGPKKKP